MNRREILKLSAAASFAAVAASGRGNAAQSSSAGVPTLSATRDVPLAVAVVVGKNANVMDFSGPWEVFQDTMVAGWNAMAFRLFMVSGNRDPVETTGGMRVIPAYAFGDAGMPQPDVIVMGAQGEHTPEKIAWIREASENASVVMTVCTGAFLLAQTGLLDNLEATTHHEYFDAFAKQFPAVRLNRTERYVENPGSKFCSAGGITSGIELALRVVQRYFGDTAPAQTAFYMEYNRSATRPAQAYASK